MTRFRSPTARWCVSASLHRLTAVDSRPYLLDNRSADTRHGEALAYLMADVDVRHGFSVATGYVNLAGLHHLATLADGRPTRLLLGAAPNPGLGAQLPPIDRFTLQLERLRDERDFSRFPPSRAARQLAAVEAWLGRPEVEVRRFVREFLHGKAYLFGDRHRRPRGAGHIREPHRRRAWSATWSLVSRTTTCR